MKTYSVIIIGAGRRGSTYANEMFKLGEKFKVVGVADPIKERRDLVQKKFGFGDEMCFNSWEDILAKPKMADVAVIATMDDMHYEPALKAI
ncbi:MAG: Gfo/Idh/MocA family oxidoreductase [Acutalibacteraceae bacterium]|nr:Gfo/Idh/MocA family oxidoreductase [Acutalibacteraceae bacterium]